jgi:hypothetical protein
MVTCRIVNVEGGAVQCPINIFEVYSISRNWYLDLEG